MTHPLALGLLIGFIMGAVAKPFFEMATLLSVLGFTLVREFLAERREGP